MFENRGCNTCHRVGGGPLIGPDLAGVTQRRDDRWLATWLKDPAAVVAKDEKLQTWTHEFGDIIMPDQNLSDEEIKELCGALEKLGAPTLARQDESHSTPVGDVDDDVLTEFLDRLEAHDAACEVRAVFHPVHELGDVQGGEARWRLRARLDLGHQFLVLKRRLEPAAQRHPGVVDDRAAIPGGVREVGPVRRTDTASRLRCAPRPRRSGDRGRSARRDARRRRALGPRSAASGGCTFACL